MSDRYAQFPSLVFERPEPGILRIVLSGPGLNSVGPAMHRELAEVWRETGEDEVCARWERYFQSLRAGKIPSATGE